MIRFYFLTPYDHRTVCVSINILRLAFSLSLDWAIKGQIILTLHSNRSRLEAWQSYIAIHTGPAITEEYWGVTRTVRRFGIYLFHSDHYVLLAEKLAKRFPWLAEVRYPMPEGEIEGQGFALIEWPLGRIKPFGWAHRHL